MITTITAVSVCDICQNRLGQYIYNDILKSHIAICDECLKKETIRRNIIVTTIDIIKTKI